MRDGSRRFPPPWRAGKIAGGYVVRDANGQSIAFVYSRGNPDHARQARVLTADVARGIAFDRVCRAHAAPLVRWQMESKRMVALKSMSVAKLTDLKEKVEAAIAEKAKARRSELEMELSELDRHDPSGKRARQAAPVVPGGDWLRRSTATRRTLRKPGQVAVSSRFGCAMQSNPARKSTASS
jgi:hypothetical protein